MMTTILRTIQIVTSLDILDSKPRLEDRRITVEQVVAYHVYEGWPVEKLEEVLGLRRAEVHAALAYYYDHRADIDRAIRENDEAFNAENDTTPDQEQLLSILDEYLSTRQAAERLGVSERRVRKLCDEGRIPARKLGINWFIHPSALELNDVQNRKPGRPPHPK